jgi:hypothetical protein
VLTITVVNKFEQVPAAVSVRIVLVPIRRINVYFFVKQENETGRHRIIVVHHTIADVAAPLFDQRLPELRHQASLHCRQGAADYAMGA